MSTKTPVRELERSNEDLRASNEEAVSLSEEHQSTSEELEASKEELRSLNEQLMTLNGQLRETIERQRASFDDRQNILNSSDVAMVFLDRDLNIRFFTPAAKSLFSIMDLMLAGRWLILRGGSPSEACSLMPEQCSRVLRRQCTKSAPKMERGTFNKSYRTALMTTVLRV